MINIGPNTFLHRFIPIQSGIYGIASQFTVDKTLSKFDVLCSGNGSISFGFGIESGKVYASGTNKVYFDALASNTSSNISAFQISTTGFDIYINDTPILVSQPKSSGNVEKLYFIGGTGSFTGTCNVEIFGNAPNLILSNAQQDFVLPRRMVLNTGIALTNQSLVDTRILSASIFGMESGNIISSQFPVLIRGGEEKFIPFSGQYLSSSNQESIFTSYIYDFLNGNLSTVIKPTEFSGLGVRVTFFPVGNIFNATSQNFILIENTGTVSTLMYPKIVATGIPIEYSGFGFRQFYNIVAASGGTTNLITGFRDPKKFVSLQSYPFFFSDRITSQKSDFYLEQHTEQVLPTFIISGSGGNNLSILEANHAGRALGFFKSNAVGHSFIAPYDFAATFITLPLRGNGDHFYADSGTHPFWQRVVNFSPDDRIGVIVYSGTGLNFTGNAVITSSWVDCSGNIQNYGFWSQPSQRPDTPSSYASGFKNQRFDFGKPITFASGATYTILLSGSGAWVNGEVSGQRYVTWQGLFHTGYSNPNPENGAIGPPQKTNGSGFCIDNTLSDTYYRAMGYQTYQPNPANYAPIGDDNFGGTLTLTGFLRKGIVNCQRFYVSENFVPKAVSMNFTSDDTDALYTGVLFTFQGQNAILNALIVKSQTNQELPDFSQIVCSGSRSHSDFYQHHLLGNTNRPVAFVQERMFPLTLTSTLSGNNTYWLVMSGTNYPNANDLFVEPVPTVRFSHNTVEPDLNYRTSNFSGKKLIFDYINNVFQSGDPAISPSNLRSSQRLSYDTWIHNRIFGDGVTNSGTRKQFYEAPMSMCFMFGIASTNFNIWDTNPQSGSVNEFLIPAGYIYNKNATSRLFTIIDPLPISLKAGEKTQLRISYDGLQGYLDYGLFIIPEFNFTGILSGFTLV